MAAPPLVFQFLGIVFAAILYGLYCLIFGLYWRIQIKRADRWKSVLLYALTAIFILCTMYFIIIIILVQFYITMGVNGNTDLLSAVKWMVIAGDFLFIAIDFISQLVLLYRCWIMWRQPLVMIIPSLISLAFLVTGLTALGYQIRASADNPLPHWYLSAITAFFFLSLAVNAIVTGLIVYRIISVYNDIQGVNSSAQSSAYGNTRGHRDLAPVISILIESGLITFVAQLPQSIMYKYASAAFPLVGGCVVMLYGISPTLLLVRVDSGVSYDNNTSRTANSSHSGRPIHLWKFNQ